MTRWSDTERFSHSSKRVYKLTGDPSSTGWKFPKPRKNAVSTNTGRGDAEVNSEIDQELSVHEDIYWRIVASKEIACGRWR